MKFFLLLALVSCAPLFADGARSSAKMGVGFSGQSNELGISLDLVSPSLFNFKSNGEKTRSDFHLYFEIGDHYLSNVAQSAGSFITVNNGLLSAGIRAQHQLPEGTGVISPYSTIGAEMGILSPTLSTSKTSFGLRVGFGCDFVFARDVDTFLGMSNSSFFVEGDVSFLHKTADKIAGSPTWREGFIPRVGMRSHF